MGKASSSKKVARAARAGGKATGQRRHIGFPVGMFVLVLLGVGLVFFARESATGDPEPRANKDHWHAAYGIYVCDRWVATFSDRGTDALGIHTHDDGLIHIHPFLAGAAGDEATIGKFFDQVGVKMTNSSLTLPPGDLFKSRKYLEGETKCDGKDARWVLAKWPKALDTDGKPTVRTSDIPDESFDNDLSAYTIAFLPPGKKIPPPPSAPGIQQGASVDGQPGQPVPSDPADATIPGGPGSTDLPVDPGSTPPTEAPPSSDAPASTDAPPSSDAPASTDAPDDTGGAEGGAGSE